MKTEPVSAGELAHILGVSRGTVSNLASDGILPRADRGLYDVAAAVQAFVRHKALTKPGDQATLSLTAERSRLARLKADAAEREAKLAAGQLVPAADIEAAWLKVALAVRSRVLQIPSKVAARVVALRTPADAQAFLQKEVHAALVEIASTPSL